MEPNIVSNSLSQRSQTTFKSQRQLPDSQWGGIVAVVEKATAPTDHGILNPLSYFAPENKNNNNYETAITCMRPYINHPCMLMNEAECWPWLPLVQISLNVLPQYHILKS